MYVVQSIDLELVSWDKKKGVITGKKWKLVFYLGVSCPLNPQSQGGHRYAVVGYLPSTKFYFLPRDDSIQQYQPLAEGGTDELWTEWVCPKPQIWLMDEMAILMSNECNMKLFFITFHPDLA